jgi:cytochrome c oxidase cbb3-type subunit III
VSPAASALVAAALLALAGCDRMQGGSTVATKPEKESPSMEAIAAVPLGDVAGAHKTTTAAIQDNPYAHNAQAVQQGEELFVRMNCAGCHGYGAKGGMGPNLNDRYWRYGGTPVQIFKSIYEGRPQGMPAWNPALPPDEIWKLVSYVQSLGGTFPADAYQAWVQGDVPGTQFPPESASTLPPDAARLKPQNETATSSSPEARPDAGGKP